LIRQQAFPTKQTTSTTRSVILKISAILSRIILSVAVLTASVASASPLTWTLDGVTYEDGATASGYFVIETTTGDMLSWDITTAAGTLGAYHYDSASSSLFGRDMFSANSYVIASNAIDLNPYVNLSFASALTAAGTVNFNHSADFDGSWECDNCATLRFLTAGSVTAVPEPAPVALFGIALAALFARRKLRK
jgi:hypothetical protein